MVGVAGANDPSEWGRETPQLSHVSGQLLKKLDELTQQARLTEHAAPLYRGALLVWEQASNPVRPFLAAAASRELMDELERSAGIDHNPPNWRQRVEELEEAWDLARRSLDAGADWNSSAFPEILEEFFATSRSEPKRRELAERTLRALDPSGRSGDAQVRAAQAASWMKFRRYLNDVVHANTRPEDGLFREELQRLELFILDWLRPHTFEDFDQLDEALAQGPPSA